MLTPLELRTSAFTRKPGSRPYVLGHRGAAGPAPENSIASFQAALDQGADGIEFDLRMSADGALVLSHDDLIEVEGEPGRKFSVKALSYSQLRRLRAPGAPPIATLREALTFQARSGALLNIELKGDVPAPGWMARKTAEEILPHGGDNVVLSSFSPTIIRALRRHLSELPCCLLFAKEHWWMKRLLPVEFLGVQGLSPEAVMLDRELSDRLHEKAPLLSAWTVNDTDEAQRLARLGVDILISDEPGQILRAFQ